MIVTFELSDEGMSAIQDLMTKTGLKSPEAVLKESVSFLGKIIHEIQNGKEVGCISNTQSLNGLTVLEDGKGFAPTV